MSTLTTSAGTLAYDSRGEGDPVLLLPSGGHVQRDYDEVRALLPAGLHSIGVDWPGHGHSPAATAPVTEASLAQGVEELLEQLAPHGAVLVGNSVGGNIATRLAIRRPDLVKGLMIIDGGGFEGSGDFAVAGDAGESDADENTKNAAGAARVKAADFPARVFCALMSRPRFVRLVYPLFSHLYTRPRTAADRRARADAIAVTRTGPGVRAVTGIWHSFTFPEHDLRPRAGAITIPTVIVWGRHDPVIPLRAAETARDLIQGSKLVVVDSGHLPHTTDPAAVAAELTALARTAFHGSSLGADA